MKWFLPYLDDTEAILNNAILYNNVVLLPNTPWNAAPHLSCMTYHNMRQR